MIIGIYHRLRASGRIDPAARKSDGPYLVPDGHEADATDGDLVVAEFLEQTKGRRKAAKVIDVIGRHDDPAAISLLAIIEHGIPYDFPSEVIQKTQNLKVPDLGKRLDLRALPLVTIDGEDARDFDDAVYAEKDTDPRNKGGWNLTVAIADVAHYVRPGSAVDKEAIKRGNSVYFPDRVVPMLPETLSNGLCSLVPHEDRASMVMQMRIDKDGNLLSSKIRRALIRSHGRLTYTQVQSAYDGHPDKVTAPLMEPVIKPLYQAYEVLKRARIARGALDLDMPEFEISVQKGKVERVKRRFRANSHKLIEEFMILANGATAQLLEAKRQPLIYRAHDKPAGERVLALRETLKDFQLKLVTGDDKKGRKGGHPEPADFSALLEKIKGHTAQAMITELILRTQSQAIYTPHNVGHFGLALTRYAHFTSPIRRYADLIVHRALIKAYGLGSDGLTPQEESELDEISKMISQTERRAVDAERSANNRYLTLYMADHLGAEFHGRISGVTGSGLFVRLEETGAEGFIPRRMLPPDYYVHDPDRHTLHGKRSKLKFHLGQTVEVRLLEAEPLTGNLIFEILLDTAEMDRSKPQFRKRRRDSESSHHKKRTTKPSRKGQVKDKGLKQNRRDDNRSKPRGKGSPSRKKKL